MNRLKVSSGRGVMFDIVREKNGKIISQYTSKEMEEVMDRWITFGLNELIGSGCDVHPRHTNATSKHFLSRLKNYLEAQFPGFIYEVFDDA